MKSVTCESSSFSSLPMMLSSQALDGSRAEQDPTAINFKRNSLRQISRQRLIDIISDALDIVDSDNDEALSVAILKNGDVSNMKQ